MAVVVVVEVVKIEQLETVHMRNLRSRFSGKVAKLGPDGAVIACVGAGHIGDLSSAGKGSFTVRPQMDSNTVLPLPGRIGTMNILNGAADVSGAAVCIECTPIHHDTFIAAYRAAVHGQDAALEPDRTSGAKAAGRTFLTFVFGCIQNGAAFFHDQLATGQAHGTHTAVVAKFRTIPQSNRTHTVVSCDYGVLHNACIWDLTPANSGLSIAFGIGLHKVFTFVFAHIIQNDVGQNKRRNGPLFRFPAYFDHRGVVVLSGGICVGMKIFSAGERHRINTIAGDGQLFLPDPCHLVHFHI